MENLTFTTNLHCEDCVKKIDTQLKKESNIHSWEVDLDDSEKILSVTGENISSEKIKTLLQRAGYRAEINHRNDLKSKHSEGLALAGFWNNLNTWNRASFNTLNCLIGCSIGDYGMLIFLQAFYPDTSMTWQMILAIIAGLITSIALETMILRTREKFRWQLAIKTAFSMSFMSMIAMEIAMNATDFLITGGKAAFTSPMYWIAFIIASIAGFLVPLPYNYYKLKKYSKSCH